MGLAEARAHVASCPELVRLLPRGRDWLAMQDALPRADRHPLYEWLELPDAFPETLESVAALCAALRAPIRGDTGTRRRRLIAGDDSDYHSAMDELYMAAALAECGLTVTLGSPDIEIDDRADSLFLELYSAHKTWAMGRLQVALSDALAPYPAGAQMEAPHDTLRLTSEQRRRVVAAAIEVAASEPVEPAPVDLEDIVPVSELRLAIVPGLPFVGLMDSAGFRHGDPSTLIHAAIEEKHGQLRSSPTPLVLAIDLAGSDFSSHMWALRVAFEGAPTICVPTVPGLVGVLGYWQGRGSLRPYMRVWVGNDAWTDPQPALLGRVIDCLGKPGPRPGTAPAESA